MLLGLALGKQAHKCGAHLDEEMAQTVPDADYANARAPGSTSEAVVKGHLQPREGQ